MVRKLLVYMLLGVVSMSLAVDYREYQTWKSTRQGENVEWSMAYAYNSKDKSGVPRVLVVGDSICAGYSGALRSALASKMNISYWATSLCVTDMAYMKQLDVILEGPVPDVIFFNNTLHSKTSPNDEWKQAYIQTVKFIRVKVPTAKLALLNGTPMKGNDAWVDDKNAIIQQVSAEMKLPLIDLHSFCAPWDRNTAWRDSCHFTLDYIAKQGQFIAEQALTLAGEENLKRTTKQVGTELGPNGKLE